MNCNSSRFSCFIAGICCCIWFLAYSGFDRAVAEPMTFKAVSTGGNRCCWWTEAEGEITNETPFDFERFLSSEKSGGGPIRFHSPGGSLFAALELGEAIRKRGFDTEVGRTNNSDKVPGVCASACAYAFMGGVGRYLEEGAKLGVHRFYNKAAIDDYSAVCLQQSRQNQSLDPPKRGRHPAFRFANATPDIRFELTWTFAPASAPLVVQLQWSGGATLRPRL